MKFKEIKQIRIYESVIKQIINLIKHDTLKPGDRLPPERVLAEKLSVNRGALREAFRVLESKGLIKSKPGGGRFIRDLRKDIYSSTEDIFLSLKKSSILELLEAREIFEVKIAEIAAQRAVAKDIKLIEELLYKMEKEKRLEDTKMENDTEFHLAVARATHNFVFVNIMKLHLELLRETRRETLKIPGRLEEQYQEHQLMFEAIKEHDIKKARKATMEHLINIKNVITKV